MPFAFGNRSLSILANCHPDIRRVAQRAIQISSIDFGVVQGRRTLDEQMRLYGKGRTAAQCRAMGVPEAYAQPRLAKVTWIDPRKGNHLSGRAIDVCPFIGGRFNWDDDGHLGAWPKIASAFKQAARELGVRISWGGDWVKSKDRPHFEVVVG